jgi:hypothetical protein
MHIDIEKLVDDIHAAEKARREGGWTDFCRARGLGKRFNSDYYFPVNYVSYVTGLYTLRAWARGRLHRKNPPTEVRDYNRSMEETGRKMRIKWDAEEHNRKLAEKVAVNYELEEPVRALG